MADFSTGGAASVPQLACVLDNAGGTRLAAVAPNQLLSLFGTGLGPADGVAAADLSTTSLAGVTVTFDGAPGRLLYVSQSQINVVVPPPGDKKFFSMQVAYNGQSSVARELATVAMAPNLFATVAAASESCPANATVPAGSLLPLTQNQDGTSNSCAHPAKPGSVVSFFLDGLGGGYNGGGYVPLSIATVPFNVRLGTRSAEVENITLLNDLVWRIDVRVPGIATGPTVASVPVGPRGPASAFNTGGVLGGFYIWVSPL